MGVWSKYEIGQSAKHKGREVQRDVVHRRECPSSTILGIVRLLFKLEVIPMLFVIDPENLKKSSASNINMDVKYSLEEGEVREVWLSKVAASIEGGEKGRLKPQGEFNAKNNCCDSPSGYK